MIAETEGAYLLDNMRFPGNYLIIPEDHVETPLDLRDDWWKHVKVLLAKVPEPLESYNLSFNYGRSAGQTLRHMHLWVVPRQEDQNAGRGLVTLLGQQPQM